MRVMKWSMIALAVSAGVSQYAMASAQDDSKGFVEDSTFGINTRMSVSYTHLTLPTSDLV